MVGPLQLVISGLLTLVVYSMALFAIYRIFKIGGDVAEIKEMLRDLKRNLEDAPVVAAPAPLPAPVAAPRITDPPQSAEALVRAVHENWNISAGK